MRKDRNGLEDIRAKEKAKGFRPQASLYYLFFDMYI